MSFNKFNYIGSKYKLLDSLGPLIEKRISIENSVIGDLFSGTSICGYYFRDKNAKKVISNDMEYYGYVIAKAFVKSTYTKNIEKRIKELNELEYKSKCDGLVFLNYSPKGGRMYFTEDNAKKIDAMRIHLNKLRESKEISNEYYYLLTCIMLASDKVANIASVYGAYLKKFKQSSNKTLEVKPLHTLTKSNKNKIYNKNINDMILKETYDIIYLDPPYNQRQYSKNYHILNYIAEYDKDIEIKGITGLLKKSNISEYCRKNEIKDSLEDLIKKASTVTKWLFMSYNSESLLSKDVVVEIFEKYGDVVVEEIDYKRFKSNSRANQAKNTTEYLFCLEIKDKET